MDFLLSFWQIPFPMTAIGDFNMIVKVAVLVALFIILGVITIRTIRLSWHRPPVKTCKAFDKDFIPLSESRLQRFQKALQFETVSRDMGDYNREDLWNFGEFIIKSFPRVHNSTFIEWKRVNKYSLLYYIRGSNSSLKPYLLMSHLDVVPVTNLEAWEVPPFSGRVVNEYIYGRGAIDIKECVMGILEAVEYLLADGMTPARSFFIAFGHDEEVSGQDGAKEIATRLEYKGVKELEYISDEGLPISEGFIPGFKKPLASIGVSEKGLAILKLSVSNVPGHSSMPPKESTIGILAKAVYMLESRPHPSMIGSGTDKEFIESLAPEVSLQTIEKMVLVIMNLSRVVRRAVIQMNIGLRILIANIWLFKSLISWYLSRKPHGNAMIRTVTSVTMFNAGLKKNVLPPLAEAIVNHRVHPSQTIKEVIEYDKNVIGDNRVVIEVDHEREPPPISSHGENDFGYQVLKATVNQLWPSAVVIPSIVLGNTDSHHYLQFTKNIYRFAPIYMLPGDDQRVHGMNERISVKNYEQVINFYFHLIRNSDQPDLSFIHDHHEDL